MLVSSAAAVIVLAAAALCLGRYTVPLGDVAEILWAKATGSIPSASLVEQNVVWLIRLPRVLAAILVGAALAVSGATFQSVFRNPLAAPELLGVFQGAAVGAAAAILLGVGSLGMQFSALVGGVVAVALTTALTRVFRTASTSILVLSGIIVAGLMSSVLGLLKYVMDPDTQLPAITFWQLGSLSDMTMRKLVLIAPTMLLAMVVLLALRWQFNLLSLGDAEARSLGVNVAVVRGGIILAATLLTACAVCLAGTVAWVGLTVPQVARMLVGPNSLRAIPVSLLLGAVFLLVIDTIGRTLTSVEIPLSILTGIVGAPVFILLIARRAVVVR